MSVSICSHDYQHAMNGFAFPGHMTAPKSLYFRRTSTANYAPIKYKFGSSTYQQHFQERKPFSSAFVIPYSRHRRNNPQPELVNSYNYPDGIRWVWHPSASAGENVTQATEFQRKAQEKPVRYHRWYSR